MSFIPVMTSLDLRLGLREMNQHLIHFYLLVHSAFIPDCERYVLIEAARDVCPQPSEMLGWHADKAFFETVFFRCPAKSSR